MSDAPDEVTVTYPFSAEEHFRIIAEQPERRWMMRSLWAMSASPVVFIGGLLALNSIQTDLPFQKALIGFLIFGLLPTALFASIPLVMSRLMTSRLRRHTPDGTEIGRRFGANGFAPSLDSRLIPWGLVTSVTETPSAFLITDASSTPYVSLPKRAMSPEHLDRFRRILNKEFQTRPKELKLLTSE